MKTLPTCLVAMLAISAIASVESMKVIQAKVGDSMLVSTGKSHYAIMNPPEENYIGLVVNDGRVFEQYAMCLVKNKDLKTVSKAEEAELAAMLMEISSKLDAPEGSPGAEQRYMLVATAPDVSPAMVKLSKFMNRKDKQTTSNIYSWGNPINSDKFEYAKSLVEFADDDIAISGGKLPKHVGRLLFLSASNNVVKVHDDGSLEMQQLDCLKGDEGAAMKTLRSKLIEIRDQRAKCRQNKRNGHSKLGSQFESAIDSAKKEMNADLAAYSRRFDNIDIIDNDGKLVAGGLVGLDKLRRELSSHKKTATDRFQQIYDEEVANLDAGKKALDQKETLCLSTIKF